MAGIAAVGAYVPLRRLQRSAVYDANRWFAPGLRSLSGGERAMANWDEDAVTLAVEAARSCLGDECRDSIHALLFASTSFPFADRQNAGIVKEALNLNDYVATIDIGMSQKAGTGALIQAFHTALSSGRTAVAVAAEKRAARPASEDELTNGDASVAFAVGADDGIARLIGTHSLSADFVDRFRGAGAHFDESWETRWVREEGHGVLAASAIHAALDTLGIAAADIRHFAAGMPQQAATALARKAGIATASVVPGLADRLGHAGTAYAPILLASALERAMPGEKLLVLGFGQGCDVLILEATDAILARRPRAMSAALARARPEANYLKYLAFSGHLRLELGKRAEFVQRPVPTALYRNRKAVLGLVGSRCASTGAVQFPPSAIPLEGLGPHEDYPLAERAARVLTFTADTLAYTPDPPGYYGMIEFEGGGRMLAEFADCGTDDVFVGAPMRMAFRIKANDERNGLTHYFWKAVPAAGSG